jgi:hypothetical protein
VKLDRVDHLVYATPDLDRSVEELTELLGVRAAAGGQHLGRGTRNALIALSSDSYLEIVGPDPGQATPSGPRWFGIDKLAGPRLVGWAVKATGLESLVAAAVGEGLVLGPIGEGSRKRPDGALLRWQFTDPATVVADGLVPFLIDWGSGPHPADRAPGGVELTELRGEHPDPDSVRRALDTVGIGLPVKWGDRPTLIATLRTNRGTLMLR